MGRLRENKATVEDKELLAKAGVSARELRQMREAMKAWQSSGGRPGGRRGGDGNGSRGGER